MRMRYNLPIGSARDCRDFAIGGDVGRLHRYILLIIATVVISGCSRPPGEDGLRESFSQQLAANKFIKDFQKNGDDLTFSAPGAEGGVAKWRVHIDSTSIEPTDNEPPPFDKAAKPFKGQVKSSWYSDNQLVRPRGRESNLPIELMANGLAQECWAFWEKAEKRWSWE